MNNEGEKRELLLPVGLYQKIENRVESSDFKSVDEYVEFVLEEVLREDEETVTLTERDEEEVKKRLKEEEKCGLLVLANERNIPDAVGGILALSDIVVVSGESASMVSEAVSSGKPVVVFNLAKRGKRKSKFEKMLKNLEEKKYIEISQIRSISSAIEENINREKLNAINPHQDDAYRYMWRLL